jgi:hypothetical protein
MKYWTMIMAGLLALILWASAPTPTMAGGVEKIKEGTREAVSEMKNEAVRAGKVIKKGAVKTGKAIKEGAKEVGKGFKKAYQETRDAVTKETSGDTRNRSDH